MCLQNPQRWLLSSSDFFDPLNNGGEDRGLFFRFGGRKIFHLNFQTATKRRSSAKRVSLSHHASPQRKKDDIISSLADM